MDRKNLFFWGLYDFANSLIQINLLLYFSQWVIIDQGYPEIYYGSVFSVSTLLLIITSPLIGVYADRVKKRLPPLAVISLIIGASYILLGLLAAASPFTKSITIIAVILAFLLNNYFYQASLIFFSSLIPALGKRGKLGTISGWGEFANNAGLISGIFLTLPFVEGRWHFYGQVGRGQAFLPSGVMFLILVIPFFLFFKEARKLYRGKVTIGLLGKRSIELIKSLPSFPAMLWFLAGFYFVSDAVRTILLFFPIYFEKVWGLPDRQKALITVGILVAMMLGSIIVGTLSDKFGTRKVLMTVVLASIIAMGAVLLFPRFGLGAVLALLLVGVFWGGYFTVSRAMLIKLSPENQVGEYFGLYTLFERFASVIAPLVWSWSLILFSSLGGSGSYRAAGAISGAIMLVGWLFFRKMAAHTTIK